MPFVVLTTVDKGMDLMPYRKALSIWFGAWMAEQVINVWTLGQGALEASMRVEMNGCACEVRTSAMHAQAQESRQTCHMASNGRAIHPAAVACRCQCSKI